MIPVSSSEKTILIAPLNWGLGHASRSIPLIQHLLKQNKEVHIASDGDALQLLKREIDLPASFFHKLPGYNINYNSSNMSWNMLRQYPKISKAIVEEHRTVAGILARINVDLIISDNRYGVYSSELKSILLTHQLNAPKANAIQRSIFRKQIEKWAKPFNEIWIPDYVDKKLSGKISDYRGNQKLNFIGPLSRFTKTQVDDKAHEILILLSGPEPSRTTLENTLADLLKNERVILVRGSSSASLSSKLKDFECYDLADAAKIEAFIKRAKFVITRAGYSSIMDFEKLGVRVIMIPTPGQQEQEYLSEWLQGQPNFTFVSENQLARQLPKLMI